MEVRDEPALAAPSAVHSQADALVREQIIMPFQDGHVKFGGRRKGVRNKSSLLGMQLAQRLIDNEDYFEGSAIAFDQRRRAGGAAHVPLDDGPWPAVRSQSP